MNSYHRLAQHARPRTSKAAMLLSGLIAAGLVGCGPDESSKEISSSTSGFRPAAPGSSAKDTPSTTKSELAPKAMASTADAKSAAPSESPMQAAPSQPAVALPEGTQVAPALPSFDPNKLDPAIEAKSYMTLKLPANADAKELVQFLTSCESAFRELMKDGSAKAITRDLVIEQATAMARLKQSAAEKLAKLATTDEERTKATISLLEALQQLSQVGDVASADELRTLVTKELDNPDEKITLRANAIALSFATKDFKNGAVDVATVVAQVEKTIRCTKVPNPAILNDVGLALEALESRSESQAISDLIDKLEVAFRDSDSPEAAMGVWQLKLQKLPDAEKLASMMDPRQALKFNVEEIRTAATGLMTQIPSPWTSFVLCRSAQNIEYSGKPLLAKEMIEVAETQLSNAKIAQLKTELTRNIEGFKKRFGLLGQPLPAVDLAEVGGAPLDMKAYEGKVVLVDFWATWCGPCVQELPNIQQIYKAKHADGFEVIGINLDDDRSKLEAFLFEKNLPWKTYVSSNPTRMGLETPIARALSVDMIPFTALIGRDGKVVDIHVRGKALERRVDELLTGRGEAR